MTMQSSALPSAIVRLCAVALALALLALWAVACIRPAPSAAITPPIVNSQVQGQGNQLFANLERDALLVDIYSETGIGKATLTITADLPVTATLRLHLTGLEHLQLSSATTTLVAQVSSHTDHAVSQSLAEAPLAASAAQPIAADHPLWLTVEPATAAQPYFTVVVPTAFLTTTQGTFTLEWVDFYR